MTEEGVINPIFGKLQKKFNELKLREKEEKAREENLKLSIRFENQTKNFENTVYNSSLYNIHEPIKEVPLFAYYDMSSELEEFIYTEYFRTKYPYSSISFENTGTQRRIKITLLDDDREKFLYARGFKVEVRQIPETYFVPLK